MKINYLNYEITIEQSLDGFYYIIKTDYFLAKHYNFVGPATAEQNAKTLIDLLEDNEFFG